MTAAGVTGLKLLGPAAVLPAAMAADVSAAAVTPTDAFLRLTGIQGDSTVEGHEGEIVVDGYSFGVSNTGSGSGTGSGQGKATFTDLALTLGTSAASPLLMVACASGRHFPDAVLTLVRNSGGQPFEFMKVKLGDVQISGYQQAGTVDGTAGETMSLRFATIEVEVTPQSASGAAGTPVTGGWDLKQNQTTTP